SSVERGHRSSRAANRNPASCREPSSPPLSTSTTSTATATPSISAWSSARGVADMSTDPQERAALFVEYRRTEDRGLRDRLIEMNIGLAEAVSRRFGGRGERHDDLLQVALVGLLTPGERFDPDRGLAFSSFATPTIEGELKRHFRDKRWAVRVPRRLQELMLEVNQSVATLTQRCGRSPTIDEIAADTKLSTEDVLEALEAGRAIVAAPIENEDRDSGA